MNERSETKGIDRSLREKIIGMGEKSLKKSYYPQLAEQIEKLRQSEERYSRIVNTANEGIWVLDEHELTTFVNPRMADMLGYKAEEMIGRTMEHFMVKEDGSVCAEKLKAGGASERYECRFLKRDGSDLWTIVSSTIIYDDKGKFGGSIAMLADISDRKRTEDALRTSEKRFRDMLENIQILALLLDREGNITFCNDYLLRLTGWQMEEILGRKWIDLFIHETDREWIKSVFTSVTGGDESYSNYENSIITRAGKELLISWNNTRLYDIKGDIAGTASIGINITEHRNIEAQLRQAQKMESIGLLAGGVAHDFNNLLTPIIGYSEMLLSTFDSGDQRRLQMQQITRAAQRAKDLTQRLLAFSRKQVIELKILDPGDLIRRFESILRRTILELVHIEIKIAPDLGLVRADAGQLEQILINLAINAQDSMPEGGVLTIEAVNIDLDQAYTSRHPEVQPGPYVMLAVSDTGAGMDEETMEHIFEPFFTTKELGKGTGLGLSTVYGIVKQHGGSISVYSEKQQGSTFKVFLPRVVSPGAVCEKELSVRNAVTRGKETILVVEDDDMVRAFAINTLESLGYQVLAAENADRCSEIAGKFEGTIDLLLTDVMMPRINGRDLYELLHCTRSDMKVLFMSGYTTNIITHRGILDEGVPFLPKPFSIQTLAEKVRNVLDGH